MNNDNFLQEIKESLKDTIIPTLEETILINEDKTHTYIGAISLYRPDGLILTSKAIAKDIAKEIMNQISCYSDVIYSSVDKNIRSIHAKLDSYNLSIRNEEHYTVITMHYQLKLETEIRTN